MTKDALHGIPQPPARLPLNMGHHVSNALNGDAFLEGYIWSEITRIDMKI